MAVALVAFYVGAGLAGLLVVIVAVYTLYLVYVRWKYSHLPSPKITSFFSGHLADLWRLQKEIDEDVSLTVAVDYWSQQVQSKTFVIFYFHAMVVVTVDPAVIKNITMNVRNGKTRMLEKAVSNIFGERFLLKGLFSLRNYESWKPRRQIYDPAFKKNYLKTLVKSFSEITNDTVNEMKPLADGKTEVPLKKYMLQLAMNILNKVAFGTDFSKIWTAESLGIEMPPNTDCTVFSYLINSSLKAVDWHFSSISPTVNRILYPGRVKQYQKCVSALRKIGRDCIMRRIKMIQNGEEIPPDILTFILTGNHDNVDIEDLVDDFLTFYVAGQETTAYTMMFSLILIAQHPNVLERLQQEVNDVLGDDTNVTENVLEDLPYLEQVISEALRVHPPAIGQSKELASPLETGDGIIPAGTDVIMMGANSGKNPDNFEEPEKFNPDRFHPSNKKPNSFTYFPFGLGHRACIGKHFALMEVKTALTRIVQTFTIKFPDGYEVKTIQRATLQPKDDVLCTLTLN